MKLIWAGCVWLGLATTALAQNAPLTLRDIADKNPRKLSKDEVTALLPGARMARVSQRGNRHIWTNESGGSFIASSDNQGVGMDARAAGRPSTAQGKWHISDDGRYCVLIEWRGVPTEEWCRFVFETIVPGKYPGRTRHYHVKVQAPGRKVLTTQLYFPGEPGNANDSIFDPTLLLDIPFGRGPNLARYDFVLDLG